VFARRAVEDGDLAADRADDEVAVTRVPGVVQVCRVVMSRSMSPRCLSTIMRRRARLVGVSTFDGPDNLTVSPCGGVMLAEKASGSPDRLSL
jgi:hypothetical protein